MKKYDHIVVGSGISGLTMSLLFAMNGHKVLLLEKAPFIGGSLSRFKKDGISFDTGFHFTGGFHEGGILADILSFLGIRELIEPVFLTESTANQFVFESHGKRFAHPSGIENVKSAFKDYFPGDAASIDCYFEKMQSVCNRTPSLNIHENVIAPPDLEEDYVSLDAVLKGLTSNKLLRGLLSGYAMCYGVRPDEISFANHCRMIFNFYESIAFVKDGGDAFIKAFLEKFAHYDVDVRCGTWITELADIRERTVGRFVLNNGEEVAADTCLFTIHPQEILKLLPESHVSRAFATRITSFEESAGFFSVFARLRAGSVVPGPTGSIVSLFPDADVNNLMDPGYTGRPALVMIRPPGQDTPTAGDGICILEPSFVSQVAAWQGSVRGKRAADYLAYKEERVAAIKDHIFGVFPEYRDTLEFLDSGSMLTFKDYLHSPFGSAYGVKQKIGQFNMIGKLPLYNLHVAGQSALLPGVIGAMMSSLIVGRKVMGAEQYGKLLERTACH